MNTINNIISKLFKERWSSILASADIELQREQLYKTLTHQLQGYWSGHSAYNIAVNGGFLKDCKTTEQKELTELGKMFMMSYENN